MYLNLFEDKFEIRALKYTNKQSVPPGHITESQ